MSPIDFVIPIIVYIAILYIFGWNVFKLMVIIGAIIGFFVVLWLFLEKDPAFRVHQKKFLILLKKVEKDLIVLFKYIFSIK
jgi:uncharacterized membrane protein YgaE (UPF0421/DUF939 family)